MSHLSLLDLMWIIIVFLCVTILCNLIFSCNYLIYYLTQCGVHLCQNFIVGHRWISLMFLSGPSSDFMTINIIWHKLLAGTLGYHCITMSSWAIMHGLSLSLLQCHKFGHKRVKRFSSEINGYLTLWGTLTCIRISTRDIMWIIFRFIKCVTIVFNIWTDSLKILPEEFFVKSTWWFWLMPQSHCRESWWRTDTDVNSY